MRNRNRLSHWALVVRNKLSTQLWPRNYKRCLTIRVRVWDRLGQHAPDKEMILIEGERLTPVLPLAQAQAKTITVITFFVGPD